MVRPRPRHQNIRESAMRALFYRGPWSTGDVRNACSVVSDSTPEVPDRSTAPYASPSTAAWIRNAFGKVTWEEAALRLLIKCSYAWSHRHQLMSGSINIVLSVVI